MSDPECNDAESWLGRIPTPTEFIHLWGEAAYDKAIRLREVARMLGDPKAAICFERLAQEVRARTEP